MIGNTAIPYKAVATYKINSSYITYLPIVRLVKSLSPTISLSPVREIPNYLHLSMKQK